MFQVSGALKADISTAGTTEMLRVCRGNEWWWSGSATLEGTLLWKSVELLRRWADLLVLQHLHLELCSYCVFSLLRLCAGLIWRCSSVPGLEPGSLAGSATAAFQVTLFGLLVWPGWWGCSSLCGWPEIWRRSSTWCLTMNYMAWNQTMGNNWQSSNNSRVTQRDHWSRFMNEVFPLSRLLLCLALQCFCTDPRCERRPSCSDHLWQSKSKTKCEGVPELQCGFCGWERYRQGSWSEILISGHLTVGGIMIGNDICMMLTSKLFVKERGINDYLLPLDGEWHKLIRQNNIDIK